MAKFTNAAKVLGGEMLSLARPNLVNLGITGAGAIAASSSARDMQNKGMSVGNTLGAAAGTAAMAVGSYRLGLHKLASQAGQQKLAKDIINTSARVAKADSSLKPLAKGMAKFGRGINKHSGYQGSAVAQARASYEKERVLKAQKRQGMFPSMNTDSVRLPKSATPRSPQSPIDGGSIPRNLSPETMAGVRDALTPNYGSSSRPSRSSISLRSLKAKARPRPSIPNLKEAYAGIKENYHEVFPNGFASEYKGYLADKASTFGKNMRNSVRASSSVSVNPGMGHIMNPPSTYVNTPSTKGGAKNIGNNTGTYRKGRGR